MQRFSGIVCGVCVAVVAAGCPATLNAAGAPPQLYNKSVLLHWSEGRSQKFPDGTSNYRVVNVDFQIYVSSSGRIFRQMVRVMQNSRGHTIGAGGSSRAPDGSVIHAVKNDYHGALQFDGHTMQSVTQYESGARRITANFDEAFSSCTMNLLHGKETDAPGIVLHGLNGRLYMLTAADISGMSCTVKPGNIFAQ